MRQRSNIGRSGFLDERFERERNGGDPKDGDLCLSRLKPGEILVEGRRGSDVQIDLKTRVYGRKTHRTI